MNGRQWGLLGVLGLTLAAVWWASRLPGPEGEGGEDLVAPVARSRPLTSQTPAPVSPPMAPVADRFPGKGVNLFPAQSWRPPPKPVVLPPPPPPQAPPLPFRYLGRWQEEGLEVVFLEERDRTSIARVGDRLGAWRVDAIRDQAMTLTYLPLDQQRTLRLSP